MLLCDPAGSVTPASPAILQAGDSRHLCETWDPPQVIVSDGAYGVGGYDGDLHAAADLADWYAPHIAAWTQRATPATTLWFWNTEVGWAEVHPVLKEHGWVYVACNVWDKGIAHIAGNCNTKTLRRFPVVTEVCVQYVRACRFLRNATSEDAQTWLRAEWLRSGLPLGAANTACGVRVAATRKYLGTDYQWYCPPAEMFDRLCGYANKHGDPAGRPYYLHEGKVLTGSQWERIRSTFHCPAGVTNVWQHGAVRGAERIRIERKVAHPNQKPLALMKRIITASSDPGDCVWEPFGGLCSASVAAITSGRQAFAAEINPTVYGEARKRLDACGEATLGFRPS